MTGQYSSEVEDVIALDDTQTLRQRDKFRPLARRWHTNIWKNTALVSPSPRKHKHDKSRHRWACGKKNEHLRRSVLCYRLRLTNHQQLCACCIFMCWSTNGSGVFLRDSKKTFTRHIYILCPFIAFSRFNSVRFLRTTSYYHVINNSHSETNKWEDECRI